MAATNPTPANDPDKCKAVLRMCGFNDITQTYIGSHGVWMTTNFAGIPYSQMDLFVDSINKPSLFPLPAQGSTDMVMLSYSSIVKMKALRAYLDYKKSRGQPLNPDSFAVGNNITMWIGRMDDLSRFAKLCDKKPSNLPDKLTSLKNYKMFKELFVTYLRQFRSVAAGTPLSYIVQKDITVTTEQHTAMYQSIDDDLMATASHSTPSYRIDNGTVFDLLKPLVIGGEDWAHILKFNIGEQHVIGKILNNRIVMVENPGMHWNYKQKVPQLSPPAKQKLTQALRRRRTLAVRLNIPSICMSALI
jgi:hypothetical protein